VREATAPIFYQILTGELAVDEGLDQMAAKAEEELTNLDYRK
jgi:multiple sugar transport system substrate-binding protein